MAKVWSSPCFSGYEGDKQGRKKERKLQTHLRSPHQFVLLPAARPDDRELSTDGHPRPACVVFVWTQSKSF